MHADHGTPHGMDVAYVFNNLDSSNDEALLMVLDAYYEWRRSDDGIQ
jgi:hypothetical protein